MEFAEIHAAGKQGVDLAHTPNTIGLATREQVVIWAGYPGGDGDKGCLAGVW